MHTSSVSNFPMVKIYSQRKDCKTSEMWNPFFEGLQTGRTLSDFLDLYVFVSVVPTQGV